MFAEILATGDSGIQERWLIPTQHIFHNNLRKQVLKCCVINVLATK